MKLSNSMKKFFAYVCAIAMVVSSMAFYGQTSVEASGSAAVEGKFTQLQTAMLLLQDLHVREYLTRQESILHGVQK